MWGGPTLSEYSSTCPSVSAMDNGHLPSTLKTTAYIDSKNGCGDNRQTVLLTAGTGIVAHELEKQQITMVYYNILEMYNKKRLQAPFVTKMLTDSS